MYYVQILACLMWIAVQTGSPFGSLHPCSVRAYTFIGPERALIQKSASPLCPSPFSAPLGVGPSLGRSSWPWRVSLLGRGGALRRPWALGVPRGGPGPWEGSNKYIENIIFYVEWHWLFQIEAFVIERKEFARPEKIGSNESLMGPHLHLCV